MTKKKTAIKELAGVLQSYGELFVGCFPPEQIASEWVEEGITDPDECGAWCAVGVWNPSVAGALRNDGITPQRLASIESDLIDAEDDPRARWTDGSPIYAICNDDLSVYDIIDEAKKGDDE